MGMHISMRETVLSLVDGGGDEMTCEAKGCGTNEPKDESLASEG